MSQPFCIVYEISLQKMIMQEGCPGGADYRQ
jgi:hypothetical protein